MIDELLTIINSYEFENLKTLFLGLFAIVGGIYGVIERAKYVKSDGDFLDLVDFVNPHVPMTDKQEAIRDKIPRIVYCMEGYEINALKKDINKRGFYHMVSDNVGFVKDTLYNELVYWIILSKPAEPEYILNILDVDDPDKPLKYLISYGVWQPLELEEAGIIKARRCIDTEISIKCNRTCALFD